MIYVAISECLYLFHYLLFIHFFHLHLSSINMCVLHHKPFGDDNPFQTCWGQPVKSPWDTSRSETPALAAITRTATSVLRQLMVNIPLFIRYLTIQGGAGFRPSRVIKLLKSKKRNSKRKNGRNAKSSAKMDRKTRNSSGLFGAPRVSCAAHWWPIQWSNWVSNKPPNHWILQDSLSFLFNFNVGWLNEIIQQYHR